MKVLSDYQIFEIQKIGGISRSFSELYKVFPSIGIENIIGIKESDNLYLSGLKLPSLHHTYLKYLGGPQYFRGQHRLTRIILSLIGQTNNFLDINQKYSISLLRKQQFDVFHPTFFDPYFLSYLGDKPFVLTIHDMIPELYPQFFKEDNPQVLGKRILASRADAIISVSEKTKEDIIRILKVPEKKVSVVYHGCSFFEPNVKKKTFDFPYILYVGDRRTYKSFDQFIKIASSVIKCHDDIKVVCTGPSFSPNELQLFSNLKIEDRLVHKWINSDEDFFSLYYFAKCFVFPSEYEGFGIPILEAFSANCPVLLNNASCFPEIAGDAAYYFSFNDIDSLPKQLEHILTMSDIEREYHLKKQRIQLQKYSWIESAKRIKRIYESVQ